MSGATELPRIVASERGGEDALSVVSFVVGEHARLAVEAHAVTEVVEAGAWSVLPRAPEHVLGLAQVRGRPVPVVDLARFFGLQTGTRTDVDLAPRLVVVVAGSMEVALLGHSLVVQDVAGHGVAGDALGYGARLRPHVLGQLRTSRGLAVLIDLPAVLEAARVRD
jgi:hypothetical protein